MGTTLVIYFGYGSEERFSIVAHIDIGKALSPLSEAGVYDIYDLDDNGIPIKHISGYNSRFTMNKQGYKEDGYGATLKYIPAKQLLAFIEDNRGYLLKERGGYDKDGKEYKYIPYLDDEQVVALITMLKLDYLKNLQVILHWS